jgi:hypothetical protein
MASTTCSVMSKIDWVALGYYLFVIGSILYFLQALNPYLTSYDTLDDQLMSYYYYGPISRNKASSIISIAAAYIFVVGNDSHIL